MPAENGQVLISPDSHIIERRELWIERLPEVFRERLPDRYRPRAGAPGRRQAPAADNGASADRRSNQPIFGAGIDPEKRISEMERDGLTAEVLYPTEAMTMFHMQDVELQEACFQVYNDNLLEYCSVAPDRVYGIGLMSAYNIDNAVKELERCRKGGMVGGMVWMTPHPTLPFSLSDHYDRLWAAAQDLEVPISLHINTGFDARSTAQMSGSKEPEGAKKYTVEAVNDRLRGAADSLLDIMFTGALDRYPKLKIVIAECEICWIPTYLQQWDHSVRRWSEQPGKGGGVIPTGIDLMPSEYFARQIFATFLEDEVGGHALEWWKAGQDNCMWSTDFPHSRTSWPHSRELMAKEIGHLSPDVIRKVVHDNAIRLYGLEVPEIVA